MKKSVKVIADKFGNIIRQNSNPEYGFIVLKQERIPIYDNGFVGDPISYTALITGKISNLKLLGFVENMELPGNIIVIESTNPFNAKFPNRHLKIDPSSGETLKTEFGENIYRENFWDSTGSKEDILIPHKKYLKENDGMLTTKNLSNNNKKNSFSVLDKVLDKKTNEVVDNKVANKTENKDQLDLFDDNNQQENDSDKNIIETPVYIAPVVGTIDDECNDETIEEEIIDDNTEELISADNDFEEFEDDFTFEL